MAKINLKTSSTKDIYEDLCITLQEAGARLETAQATGDIYGKSPNVKKLQSAVSAKTLICTRCTKLLGEPAKKDLFIEHGHIETRSGNWISYYITANIGIWEELAPDLWDNRLYVTMRETSPAIVVIRQRYNRDIKPVWPAPGKAGKAAEAKGTSGTGETGKEVEEQDPFDILFTRYMDYEQSSREILDDMLKTINAGNVPAKSRVSDLDRVIAVMQEQYDGMSEAVRDILEEDGMGAPTVYVLKNTHRESGAKRAKKRLEEVRRTLQRFISVRALAKKFEDALLPFQAQARELMDGINSSSINIEEAEKGTAAPKTFLTALDCEDYTSDAGINIYAQASAVYPPAVMVGFMTRMYQDAGCIEADFREVQKEKDASPAETGPAAPERETAAGKTGVPADIRPVTDRDIDTAVTETCGQDTEDEPDVTLPETFKSDASSCVIDPGALGCFQSSLSAKRQHGKISAAIFKEDIGAAPNPGIAVSICKTLQSAPAFIIDTMEDFDNGFFFSDALKVAARRKTIDYFVQKGYLGDSFIVDKEHVYTATERLWKALEYEQSREYAEGSRIEKKWAFKSMYPSVYASLLTKFLVAQDISEAMQDISEEEDIDCFCTVRGFHEAFICTMEPEADTEGGRHVHNIPTILSVVAFWTELDTCEDSCKRMLGCMQEPDISYGIAVVAGLDKETAQAQAELFVNAGILKATDCIILYDFKEAAYYENGPGKKRPLTKHIRDFIASAAYAGKEGKEQKASGHGALDIKTGAVTTASIAKAPADKAPKVVKEPAAKPSPAVADAPKAKAAPAKKAAAEKPAGKASPKPVKKETAAPVKAVETPEEVPAEKAEDMPLFPETESRAYTDVCSLLEKGIMYAAAAYADTDDGAHLGVMAGQFSMAVADPASQHLYTGEQGIKMIAGYGGVEDGLMVSIALRVFFSNQVQYDYSLRTYYDSIKDYGIVEECPCLSTVLYSLMDFKSTYQKGIEAYVYSSEQARDALERELFVVKRDAADAYENFVSTRKKENARQKRFVETKNMLFNKGSELGESLEFAATDNREMYELVHAILVENFIIDGMPVSKDTIDEYKLWEYIASYWNEAGDKMSINRRSALISHLKSNIMNQTTKAVQVLARWCSIVDKLNKTTEDSSTIAYKKLRTPLLKNLGTAMEQVSALPGNKAGEKAGARVVYSVLAEIKELVRGGKDAGDRRYFYMPFLLTDNVTLTEDLLPDFDTRRSDLPELQPGTRIMKHAETAGEHKDYAGRLRDILDNGKDNYGTAELILTYLTSTGTVKDEKGISEQIAKSIDYAKESASLKHEDFIGELELAQSYGQIDNSEEDRKDRILESVDEWWKWAEETKNFGFFKRILEWNLQEIRKQAKSRETVLLKQLDEYRRAPVAVGMRVTDKIQRALKIEEMIHDQNYTVAEDLLSRTGIEETTTDALPATDCLMDLLYDYDDYYRDVSVQKTTLTDVIRRYDLDDSAESLAGNWMPDNKEMTRERVQALLKGLGFHANNVKEAGTSGSFPVFHVRTSDMVNGERVTLSHPIAAFGSMASEEGFRVVPVSGRHNADSLVEIMQQLGSSKNTLILLDSAMTLADRRHLAKKTKHMIQSKLFLVLDRVVMMYILKHYDPTSVNRMLVALLSPFGYFQPYVWDSAKLMPPEIFIGRRRELEQIKSPSGVNIVYGGRQLGKSALLKKAKADVDRNENGCRALLVDIKGLDYKASARKVGHALYDNGILRNDIDTEDWDELARAVKRRLLSRDEYIPYFLLLLDEADAFIESSEEVNYHPFDSLKDIQQVGLGRFKFVIAGLHNVVRFKREAALSNNSVLTHLESLTVQPFAPAEARELIELPLYYLGFRFPKAKEPLITLILATTNYFPGLIQMYCAKLVASMSGADYAGYAETDTPVYEVSEKHIKKVLSDPEFMAQIRDKFTITLRLGGDNIYYLIALITAYLHYNGESEAGCTAYDIWETATDYEIRELVEMGEERIHAFLAEMKELNLLRSNDGERYSFSRYSFLQMIGTKAEVEDKILSCMSPEA